jgi:hypothetical protein
MQADLRHLVDDPRLEDGAAERVLAELLRTADAEEVAEQSRVVEVELRCLHEPGREVRVIRRQAKGDEARFQHRDPGTRGDVADAGIRRERRQIQELG